MNPVHLDTLLAIVDEGSFDIAAAVLGVSPSAVSQRIKALETSTGRVLLRRATPVTATEAGEVLVQAARRMALVQAETDARLQERLSRVPLNVAVNSGSLATWFRPVFRDMAASGRAALRIRIEDEDRTLAMLRRGDVLGAITREEQPVSGCESTPLGVMRYRAVAAPALARAFRTNEGVNWQEIPIVMYGPNDAVLDAAMRDRFIDSHVARHRVSQVPSSEGYLEAVVAGMGWGLIPDLQAVEGLEVLDDAPLDVPLYWQRWRLESEVLELLTRSVDRAAKQLRSGMAPGF
ncbi:ArgP/LysG family DNA-binding transcriptional regulator [Corynebacterium incognita]|uniref:ArgP/LysG family DNA-binding transcriptional regulator n=1 Tax=Corynebacterium incognita TaxID=2754725 RepID=A0A7G7CPC1_9CORY|nr:ArgP/LysG family DNA-binding transcriptional regulator [Corynebacterium incognita]QNE89437.1 ArgP/LysG family DNA-binding transcriptional regulator [Corynebacterium incognita]